MGFFSVIKIKDQCPNCKKNTGLTIQFKYGEKRVYVDEIQLSSESKGYRE